MTNKQIPTPVEFLLVVPLYAEITFVDDQCWKVVDLLYFGGTYDSFCPKCGRDSTFQVIVGERPPGFTRNDAREKMLKAHGANPEFPALETNIYRVHARCTRQNAHTQDFLFFIDRRLVTGEAGTCHTESFIQKIGQQPSFADLHISKIKRYAPVLTKPQLRELNRAIGLASHDVGVGSYVYLRRVFEGLIEEAHEAAKVTEGWDDDVYFRSRVGERIALLKHHLPSFLVEHPKMYSLLSKGVHELSEEECLAHFDTLRIGVELILDEKLERKERERKVRDAKAALTKAFGDAKA